MGGFKLGKMTLSGLFKQPETIQYPVQKKVAPAGLKGHVTNDTGACILCGICQKRCPTGAIVVDKLPGAHLVDRPLPLRAVRQLRARMPQAVPGHGAHLHVARHGEVRRHLRGAREGEDGVACTHGGGEPPVRERV